MLSVLEERRLHQHQCGRGGDVGSAAGGLVPPHGHSGLVLPVCPSHHQTSSSSSAVVSSQSLAAAHRVSRKYRQAAVRRREYRKLKAIVPAVSDRHAVSKVGYNHVYISGYNINVTSDVS